MSAPVTITDVQTILTAPDGIRLVVVKVLTSEPGLYGLGCATFTQRALAVATAIDKYLRPFVIGRDVDRIEDIYQACNLSGYRRSGPVLNNALSGIDQALWDIKAKRAGMPLYQLFGGKCREAVPSTCTLRAVRSRRWRKTRGALWSRATATSAARWPLRVMRPTATAGEPRWPP